MVLSFHCKGGKHSISLLHRLDQNPPHNDCTCLLSLVAFWWSLEGFLYRESRHLQIELYFFLPILYSFYFSLAKLARPPTVMSNGSGESGRPCLGVVLAEGLSVTAFIALG